MDGSISNLKKITNINFKENNLNRNAIINNLIDLTDLSHRDFNNIGHNPDLVLSILRKAFGYAAYYNHSELMYSDIEEAVASCESIYPSVRERFNRYKKIMVGGSNIKEKNKVIYLSDIRK